eukprot:850593-Pelagomonas_calceolata.AAC.6
MQHAWMDGCLDVPKHATCLGLGSNSCLGICTLGSNVCLSISNPRSGACFGMPWLRTNSCLNIGRRACLHMPCSACMRPASIFLLRRSYENSFTSCEGGRASTCLALPPCALPQEAAHASTLVT